MAPKAAPTNTSISLEIRKEVNRNTDFPEERGLALSMFVSATNQSARKLDLFHSILVCFYEVRFESKNTLRADDIDKILNADTPGMVSRYTVEQEVILIAFGRLLRMKNWNRVKKVH